MNPVDGEPVAKSAKRVTSIGAAAAIIAFVVLWLVGHVLDVLLLGFAGVLLAIFLDGLARWVAARTPLRRGAALGVVCAVLVLSAAGATWRAAPQVAHQVDGLTGAVPRGFHQVSAGLRRYEWGQAALDALGDLGSTLVGRRTVSQATGAFSATLGAVGSLVVFLFVALFVAIEPGLYRDGLVRLVPPRHRPRAREVIARVVLALRQWILGKAVAMIAVGVCTWGGLVLLDVPLALTLALLAALLTFVPNVGPVLSAVPAVLLGLLQSTSTGLYVAALFLGIQVLESYVLTPLIQKKTVSLPPALTLLGQVVMGLLAGGLGVVVATPLTAVVVVVIRSVYIEDILGDRGQAE